MAVPAAGPLLDRLGRAECVFHLITRRWAAPTVVRHLLGPLQAWPHYYVFIQSLVLNGPFIAFVFFFFLAHFLAFFVLNGRISFSGV
jgi:hypothetical protein